MNILVTGAMGNVGRSTLESLRGRGHRIRILEKDSPAARRTAARIGTEIDVRLGDILNIGDVMDALKDIDAVIHLAAVIPPAADRNPETAQLVNVEGTRNLLYCMKNRSPAPKLVFASSIAVYGDRISAPFISTADPPAPNPEDGYALQKLDAEKLVRSSGLDWAILRLSYIADPYRLKLDPLMFEMPLATSLEICDTGDAGAAFAAAVVSTEVSGRILHIAGGAECRTTYREYLQRMLSLMGLGKLRITESAFSTGSFHCGFMDTRESEKLLRYQHHSLSDFYREVERIYASRRFFVRFLRKTAVKVLYLKSPYFMHALRSRFGAGLTVAALRAKYFFSPEVHLR